MAVIQCSECGGKVSTTVPSCPHCGYQLQAPPARSPAPHKKSNKKKPGCFQIALLIVIGGIFLILIIAIFGSSDEAAVNEGKAVNSAAAQQEQKNAAKPRVKPLIELGMPLEEFKQKHPQAADSEESKDGILKIEYKTDAFLGVEGEGSYKFIDENLVSFAIQLPEEQRDLKSYKAHLKKLIEAYGNPLSSGVGYPKGSKPLSTYKMPIETALKETNMMLVSHWANEHSFTVFAIAHDAGFILSISDQHKEFDKMKEKLNLNEMLFAPLQSFPRLGEPVKLGTFTYTVQGLILTEKVGSSFLKETVSSGATFVVVRYTIENIGQQTASVLAGDPYILDAKGRKFQTSTKAMMAMVSEDDDVEMIVSQLQPGIPKNMVVVFEVPSGVASDQFKVVFPEKGLLGSGKIEMDFIFPR